MQTLVAGGLLTICGLGFLGFSSQSTAQQSSGEMVVAQALPQPGVPKFPPPKGPIQNGDKPGSKPDPEKGQKPDRPRPKGNGHKPDKKASAPATQSNERQNFVVAEKTDKKRDCDRGKKKSDKC